MKEKTIKSVLVKKFHAWLDSIEDKNVRDLVEADTIITGGCFVSLILNEKPSDFDVYFRNKATVLAVAKYYADRFNKAKGENIVEVRVDEQDNPDGDHRIRMWIQSKGIAGAVPETADAEVAAMAQVMDDAEDDKVTGTEGDTGNEPYRPVFFSANAISLSDKIQITVRFWGQPSDIHDTYDFVHTKAYWTSWDNQVVIPKEVYEAVINKSLVYTGSKYPVCSVFRLRKFIKRGWNVNAGQILKMAFQISKLDLEDLNVLEDQLVGVDSAYFAMLIEQLRRQKEKNPEFEVTEPYLVSIIDKIF